MSQLVTDIYRVVSEGVEVTQEQADEFGKSLSDLIAQRLRDRKNGEQRKFTLRMSNIGKGARQLWYDKKFGRQEDFLPHTLIKFMFGDIIEQLLLFLVSLSGHTVTAQQEEVQLNGIVGHIDADIDGVTVDVKSASTYSFSKFKDGTLPDNDSFGYMEQIASYSAARNTDGAFLAVDKSNGHVTLLPFSKEELQKYNVEERIEYLKQIVESDDPPERCYPDEEYGKSGNRALGVNCSYCPHKKMCWQDSNGGIGIRTFSYARGPVFMTNVVEEPRVHEIAF